MLRFLCESDLPAILRIQSRCYTEVPPESEVSIRAKLGASPATCFGVYQDEELVAYLISVPIDFDYPPELNADVYEAPPEANCLYLHDLAVDPSSRKSGTGKILVDAFIEKMLQLKYKRAALIAVQDSSKYWERYGFRRAETTTILMEKLKSYGEDAVYMELKI